MLQFQERYTKLYENTQPPPPEARRIVVKAVRGRRQLSDDEAERPMMVPMSAQQSTTRPWEAEFWCYLETKEDIREGTSSVQWWEVGIL